jgi:hypothetical protein
MGQHGIVFLMTYITVPRPANNEWSSLNGGRIGEWLVGWISRCALCEASHIGELEYIVDRYDGALLGLCLCLCLCLYFKLVNRKSHLDKRGPVLYR